jgi:hypothetical protein
MAAVMDNISWESDEAYDGESDEAYDGEDAGEDYGEDFGEASRRRGRRARPRTNGVKGVRVQNAQGVHKLSFPQKLALAKDTNQGFASLSDRLAKAEAKFGTQAKRDAAVLGSVTLALGVPLTILGVMDASANKGVNESTFHAWGRQNKSAIAAVTSATQLVTTAAKYAIERRVPHSALGTTSNIFSAIQLAAYGLAQINSAGVSGRLNKDETNISNLQTQLAGVQTQVAGLLAAANQPAAAANPPAAAAPAVPAAPPAPVAPPPQPFADLAAAKLGLGALAVGAMVITMDNGRTYAVIATANAGQNALKLVD